MALERAPTGLILALTLAVAPLAPHVPYWISAFWGVCALLRLTGRETLLPQWLRLTLAGLAIAGVVAEHHTVFGPRGGVALLVCMSALKLLETQSRRDLALMALIGYFLLMTPLINGQGLVLAIYLAMVSILITAELLGLQPSSALATAGRLRLAARLTAQALPVAVLLFLLFPRIPTPFGGLMQTQSSQTGLSDSMQPGSVSELIQSDAVAFRVEFEGSAPPTSELYWRGPVLWNFDGRVWRPPESLPLRRVQNLADGRLIAYTITLEPHRQRWLFTVGLPERAPDVPAVPTTDFQWLAKEPVTTRLRYRHRAFLDYRMDLFLTPEERALALALPDNLNPRSRELIAGWRAQGQGDEAMARHALAYFREEPFYYTLRPPPLGRHGVDDFIFETRRGFCEHYAGSFVVLMRMAGIPARVVTGYQGAERNVLGDYWIVRQRDAHAWAEIWLAGRGWVRFDPTAAVAPERVERGIGAALPAAERPVAAWDNRLLRPVLQAWDMVNTQWNRWVIGYDEKRQYDLLSRLNPLLGTLQGMLWALLVGAGVFLAVIFWSLAPRRARARRDEAAVLYERFRARLRRAGLDTPANEGPRDLAMRAAHWRPELAEDTRAIATLYIALRYADAAGDGLAALRARVRRFKP
jgi:transglutaminase-like putative cysteine protease